MNDELESKLIAVLSFFYKELFQKTYYDEITNVINEHEVLPIVDEELLENIALVWCMSYYLLPIIDSYAASDDFEQLIQIVSGFTGIDKRKILIHNEKAKEFLESGPFGAFQYYWFLFNKIGNNQIPAPKNAFVSPMFTLIATQLVEYGAKGLEALEKDFSV